MQAAWNLGTSVTTWDVSQAKCGHLSKAPDCAPRALQGQPSVSPNVGACTCVSVEEYLTGDTMMQKTLHGGMLHCHVADSTTNGKLNNMQCAPARYA